MGDQASILALALTAVLLLSASPLEMGLLGASQTLPWLLVGLVVGRVGRQTPAAADSDSGGLGPRRAALLASVPVMAVFAWLRIEQLYLIGFLAGMLNVFFCRGISGIPAQPD